MESIQQRIEAEDVCGVCGEQLSDAHEMMTMTCEICARHSEE
ncbi:hypothetical protein [Ferroacidibacillus organovorans]|nr:hypothetical protein [Ferroacidibacillus organovorans]